MVWLEYFASLSQGSAALDAAVKSMLAAGEGESTGPTVKQRGRGPITVIRGSTPASTLGGTIVKLAQILLVALMLTCGSAKAASEWAERIRAVVPGNISLTEVEETEGYVRMVGHAKSNADISALMRAIDAAGLGAPELQRIKRNGDMSSFVLRVKVQR